jgi:hypothetical protein
MDEIDFTLDGNRYRLTRDMVIASMRSQIPGRVQTYAVDIDGVRFPVKQVLAQALRIPVTSFVSTRAQDLLTKLDFDVLNVEGGAESAVRPDRDSRSLALQLAVEFHARRGDSAVNEVLAVATQFARWLEA